MKVRTIRKHSDYISEFLALSYYKEGIRNLIVDLKFKKQQNRAKVINYILENADGFIREYPKNIFAVFVPISEERRKERGFNQVELMFKNWLENRGIKTANLLIRQKATEHQYMLNPNERRQNVTGAFKSTKKLSGENILLLDDILTTGATLEECAKTLKEAGAGKIFALAFSSDNK